MNDPRALAEALAAGPFEMPEDMSVSNLLREIEIADAIDDLLYAMIDDDDERDSIANALREHRHGLTLELLSAEPTEIKDAADTLYWISKSLKDGTLDHRACDMLRRVANFISLPMGGLAV